MAPVFAYRARDRTGKLVEGTVEAENSQLVLNQLWGQNLIVIKVEEQKKQSVKSKEKFYITGKKVTTKDLAIFSRQFATMINAGIPLLRSLNIMQQQIESKSLQKALQEVIKELERGLTLSEAMGKYPKVFPVMYINMVAAGEVGGVLEQVLERMAVHFEKEDEITEKVKSALTYPGVILLLAILAIIFMLTFVLPTFTGMLLDLDVEMPFFTQLLINLSGSLRNFWYLYLVGTGLLIGTIIALLKKPAVKYLWDLYSLKLPIYGDMQRKVIISRFSRTLATLLHSGVPIITSLDVVKKTTNNLVMADSVNKAKESIREGESIAEPLKASGILTPMAINMIAVGEETGELDNMLEKISFFFDREVDHTVKRLSASLEPILLVGVGIIIGGIVLAMLLPMVQIYSAF